MCVKTVLQSVFNVILIACFVLTAVAIFTPGWRKVQNKENNETIYRGLVVQECLISDGEMTQESVKNTVAKITTFDFKKCMDFWTTVSSWEKFVFATFVLSGAAIVLTLAWSCVTCGLCCCQPALASLLPALCLLAFALSMTGTSVYISREYRDVETLEKLVVKTDVRQSFDNFRASLGYSVFLAAFASVGLFVDTVIGIFLLTVAKSHLPI